MSNFILFEKDWLKFPTAFPDYNTTNDSFLRLVYLYKKMGIRNSEFPLALYQKDLVGVDPYAENLSAEQKTMIAMEARYNPWYFWRCVCRVPPNSGNVPRQFEANRGNIALFWSFFNHIDFGLVQPRQTGKSVSTDTLNTGLMNLWATNTTINLITKDAPLRLNNIERLKRMRNLLPDYIYTPHKDDLDNTEIITNMGLGNWYKGSVGRNDKIAADKLGRGLTVPILHFDELAYILFIAITMPVALSSGSAARDEAAAAGQPYGNIYTTTAGNMNSRDGRYAHQFLTGGAPWSEHLLDLPDQPTLAAVVEKQSTGNKPLIYGAFNHRQLGKTDEWLYRKMRESAATGEIADRDWMNVWTTGTEGSPISPEDKQRVKNSERDIEHMELFDNSFVLRWYIPEHEIANRMASSVFAWGADPSECLGDKSDATGLVLTDLYTHDVVACARINEANLSLVGLFIAEVLVKYPTITFVPERKSTGTAILGTLFVQLTRANQDPFRRIYNRIASEPETYPTEFAEIRKPLSSRPAYFYDRYTRYFGFVTAGTGSHSRDALYVAALGSALKLGASRVYDKTLIGEILSLTTKNGRIDHSQGNHDDMVIAWLLTNWFATQTTNLQWYGIDPTRVFALAVVSDEEETLEGLYRGDQRRRVQMEFNDLLNGLKTQKDPMVIARMEMRLRQLSKQYDFTEGQGVGIDAMLKQAQDERARRNKVARFGSQRQSNMASNWNQLNRKPHTGYILPGR